MEQLPPTQGGFSFEVVFGTIVTVVSGWLAKLHVDVQSAKDSHAKLREELAAIRSGVITRDELRSELRDHKTGVSAEVSRLEVSISGQLANLARSIEKLENRINH